MAAMSQLLTTFVSLVSPHTETKSRSEVCKKAGGKIPWWTCHQDSRVTIEHLVDLAQTPFTYLDLYCPHILG